MDVLLIKNNLMGVLLIKQNLMDVLLIKQLRDLKCIFPLSPERNYEVSSANVGIIKYFSNICIVFAIYYIYFSNYK